MSEKQERPTCETCPYWDAAGAEKYEGVVWWAECRRFPATIEGDEYRGVNLLSHRVGWCGEHPSMAAWIEQQRKERA